MRTIRFIGVCAAALVAFTATGCGMTASTDVSASVRWQLSKETRAADLYGGTPVEELYDSALAVVTPSGNSVDALVTLPSGETIDGSFNSATVKEGSANTIRYLTFSFAPTTSPDEWRREILNFTDRWGGNAEDMLAFIRTAQGESYKGAGANSEYSFDGDPTGTYTPSIGFVTGTNPFAVTVFWEFDLDGGQLGTSGQQSNTSANTGYVDPSIFMDGSGTGNAG